MLVPQLGARWFCRSFRMSCWTVTTPLLARDRILRTLERQAGNHPVIVHYRDDHSADVEWVYNAADIDRSKVVWAQDMGFAKNGELAEYFKGWKIWTVDADAEEPPLMSEEPAGGPTADQGVRPTKGV